jgi:hypothetical protein
MAVQLGYQSLAYRVEVWNCSGSGSFGHQMCVTGRRSESCERMGFLLEDCEGEDDVVTVVDNSKFGDVLLHARVTSIDLTDDAILSQNALQAMGVEFQDLENQTPEQWANDSH